MQPWEGGRTEGRMGVRCEDGWIYTCAYIYLNVTHGRKQGRKRGGKEGREEVCNWKEGRYEGMKDAGRKEGRRERGKEGRKGKREGMEEERKGGIK
jgi:hypothetical protein